MGGEGRGGTHVKNILKCHDKKKIYVNLFFCCYFFHFVCWSPVATLSGNGGFLHNSSLVWREGRGGRWMVGEARGGLGVSFVTSCRRAPDLSDQRAKKH